MARNNSVNPPEPAAALAALLERMGQQAESSAPELQPGSRSAHRLQQIREPLFLYGRLHRRHGRDGWSSRLRRQIHLQSAQQLRESSTAPTAGQRVMRGWRFGGDGRVLLNRRSLRRRHPHPVEQFRRTRRRAATEDHLVHHRFRERWACAGAAPAVALEPRSPGLPGRLALLPQPGSGVFTGSGAFTTPKTPVAPKSCSEPESSGRGVELGPAGVVGLSMQSGLRCDAGSINHSVAPDLPIYLKRICV